MPLRAIPSRPTSVLGVAGLTRRERSPAAIAPAVRAIRSSGRSPRRTTRNASAPSARRTPPITSNSTSSSRFKVWSTSRSGTATTVWPLPSGSWKLVTR